MPARRTLLSLLILVAAVLAPASAQANVSNVKVSNDYFNENANTFAAGTTDQSMVIFFTLTQALGGSSQITIDMPAETVLPSNGYQIGVGMTGWSTPSRSFFDNNTGVTLNMWNDFSAPAGTRIRLQVYSSSTSFRHPTTAGSKTLTVSTSAEPVPVTSASYSIVAGPPSQLIATGGTGQSTTVGTAFADPLTVKAADQYGNGVSGQSVTVDLPSAGATGTFPGPDDSYTASTNASGEITTPTIAASTAAGLWNASASSSGLTSTTVQLTNTPDSAFSMATHTGNNQSADVGTDYGAPFVVEVSDQYGNPVPGEDVTFSVPGTGPSGQFLSTTFPVATGSDGLASSGTLTANGTPGTFKVTATHSNLGFLEFDAENLVGDPAVIQVTGMSQTATVGQAFGQQLNMQVFDNYGNPVSGVPVDLNLPTSGPSARFAPDVTTFSGTTDSGGNLLAPVMTANTIAGDWSGTASSAGVPDTTIDETNAPGAAAAMTTVSGSGQSAGTGRAFAAPVVVGVEDQFGNPVPNVPVTFSAPSSGPSGAMATLGPATNAAGRASSGAITANNVVGQWTLTAAAGPLSTTAGLRNLDVTAPTVRFTRKPKARSANRRARFAFRSSEAGSRFQCRMDRGKFTPCKSPATRRVKPGKHVFSVRAIDAAGNTGAIKRVRFRVLRS